MPSNIAGAMLVSVVNPDGTIVGGGGGGTADVNVTNNPLPVSGTVTVNGTVTATPTGTQTVSGTVNIGTMPAVTANQTYFTTTNSVAAAPVAPGAAAVVATTTVAATGTYDIVVSIVLAGAGTPVTNNNYTLQVGAQPVLALLVPALKGVQYMTTVRATVAAGNAVAVSAVAAEAASVTVATNIVVTRLS